MGIGLGIFLMIIGGALKFGITADVAGLNLDAIGIIFMLAGFIVVLLTLGLMATRRKRKPGNRPHDDADIL